GQRFEARDPEPERVELGELGPDEAEGMMRELLRPLGPPPERVVAHARAAFATPRALVELVRWLLEAGVIVRAGGGRLAHAARARGAGAAGGPRGPHRRPPGPHGPGRARRPREGGLVGRALLARRAGRGHPRRPARARRPRRADPARDRGRRRPDAPVAGHDA